MQWKWEKKSNGPKIVRIVCHKHFCYSETNTRLAQRFFLFQLNHDRISFVCGPTTRQENNSEQMSRIKWNAIAFAIILFFWRFTRLRFASVKSKVRFIYSLPHKSTFLMNDKSGVVPAQPLTKERFIFISMEMYFQSSIGFEMGYGHCAMGIIRIINYFIGLMKSRGDVQSSLFATRRNSIIFGRN